MISSRILSNAVRNPPNKVALIASSVTGSITGSLTTNSVTNSVNRTNTPTTNCTLSSHSTQLDQFNASGFKFQPGVHSSRVPAPPQFRITTGGDQEAKDLFEMVWSKFIMKLNRTNQTIPSDILWLIGAPGSGKGTVTPYILRAQATTNPPICMSSLLQSPQLRAEVDAGRMVDDVCVLELLLDAIVSRNPNEPVIIDGFPRTHRQVEFVTLLHQKLNNPTFKVAILYVSQSTSLARQLQRGLDARLHNERVRQTGVGRLKEERATDFDRTLVMTRYRAFAEHMEAIMALAHNFPFHMINANEKLDTVVSQIIQVFDPHYPSASNQSSSPPPSPSRTSFPSSSSSSHA